MEILEQVQAVLCAEGVSCEMKDDCLSTSIQAGIMGCALKVYAKRDFLKCIILIPLFSPMYRYRQMCEAVCRANFGLKFGRFDFDPDDGQLLFLASLPIKDAEPSTESPRALTMYSWQMCEIYVTSFAEVATSAAEPEAAISRAEASFREEVDTRVIN
jgi:hypothetical protein